MREQIARDVWDRAQAAWMMGTAAENEQAVIAVIQEALEKVAQAAIDASAEYMLNHVVEYGGGSIVSTRGLVSESTQKLTDGMRRALSPKAIVEGVK